MKATMFFRLHHLRYMHRLSCFYQRHITVAFLLGICCLVLFCSGCAQMYTGFQAVGVQSCHTLSYPEQQECLDQVNLSYDEYEEEREQSTQL